MKNITVVGSMSIDHVATADHFPAVGETLLGEKMVAQFGGKGANQAVACARLGATVRMIGALGDDRIGERILENFKANQVSTNGIEIIDNETSGQTLITVANGDNMILVIPGTNNELTVEHIHAHREDLFNSDFVILQNEVQAEVIETVINFCHDHGIKVVYNPAPARALSEDLIQKVDYLTPNETEVSTIFGHETPENILGRYPNKLMVTLGSEGVIYHNGHQLVHCPAFKVETIVDTTGAGDTFNGAFTIALAYDLSFGEAILFGQLAAAFSIQEEGAQGGIPTLTELKESQYFKEDWRNKF